MFLRLSFFKTFCCKYFAEYPNILHIARHSLCVEYPNSRKRAATFKLQDWFQWRNGRKKLSNVLNRNEVGKASTHEKPSGPHVPWQGQAKAHVGFHLGHTWHACGSFLKRQRFENMIYWDMLGKQQVHLCFTCSTDRSTIYPGAGGVSWL